jgi:hypothetical protein
VLSCGMTCHRWQPASVCCMAACCVTGISQQPLLTGVTFDHWLCPQIVMTVMYMLSCHCCCHCRADDDDRFDSSRQVPVAARIAAAQHHQNIQLIQGKEQFTQHGSFIPGVLQLSPAASTCAATAIVAAAVAKQTASSCCCMQFAVCRNGPLKLLQGCCLLLVLPELLHVPAGRSPRLEALRAALRLSCSGSSCSSCTAWAGGPWAACYID